VKPEDKIPYESPDFLDFLDGLSFDSEVDDVAEDVGAGVFSLPPSFESVADFADDSEVFELSLPLSPEEF